MTENNSLKQKLLQIQGVHCECNHKVKKKGMGEAIMGTAKRS